MKIVLFIIAGFVALIISAAVFLGFTYKHYYDLGAVYENDIKAQYEQNQNVLSSLSLRVVEQMGVAKEYKKAVQDVIKQGMEGRFGANGSGALLQAFTEAYPGQLSPEMYIKVQNSIESGRKDFENEQKLLISKVQVYQNALDKFWSGLWLKFVGKPKIDLNQYKVIVSTHTQDTFKSGVDKGITF